jgi:hypothetical protein
MKKCKMAEADPGAVATRTQLAAASANASYSQLRAHLLATAS